METNTTAQFISHLLNASNLNSDRIVEMIMSFTDSNCDDAMRILSYITGFIQKPVVNRYSSKINKKSAELINYDFFKDELNYKHLENRKVSYSEEDAEKYKDSVFNSSWDIPSKSGDIETDVWFWKSSTCHLHNWQ